MDFAKSIGMGPFQYYTFIALTHQREDLVVYLGYVTKQTLVLYQKPTLFTEKYSGFPQTVSKDDDAFTFNSLLCVVKSNGSGLCYDPVFDESATGKIYDAKLGKMNFISAGESTYYGFRGGTELFTMYKYSCKRIGARFTSTMANKFNLCMSGQTVYSSKTTCFNSFGRINSGFVEGKFVYLVSSAEVYIFQKTALESNGAKVNVKVISVNDFVTCSNELLSKGILDLLN